MHVSTPLKRFPLPLREGTKGRGAELLRIFHTGFRKYSAYIPADASQEAYKDYAQAQSSSNRNQPLSPSKTTPC